MSVAEIHPTAIVADGARLGAGVTIGPYATVGAQVVLAEGVQVGAHAVLDGITHLAEGVQVLPFASVGLPPQDLKYKGEPTRVEVGPRTIIREHATVHRGSVGGEGVTRLGAECLIMCVAHVGHDCQLEDKVILANNVMLGGHVHIGDNVFIGGGTAIHQSVRIGRQAVIGGMSGVERDVIPFGSCMGNRARLIGLNLIGLKRRGFGREAINALRAAYRGLFLGRGTFDARVALVTQEHGEQAQVAEVLAFIEAASRRGLMRAGRQAGEAEAEAA
ncbi:acyl-ACP--UDP-N-acetylglucosamine O-acyltransferase [Roseomonas sp. KE2513]|uniref:acyl-ACP--UDP-N-acetylglucosamine O-acyltransferase n=1 Tax=Roseomonas sp. KE2513 TaxID=2479202 RepID=UPI0018DF7E4B|nr:acyl-ACP--UDP-N-acetylglucosamine O-acyltransferase [Roseomonas sp. KE2513]MBI0539343.1 acyl-ACP--UDP-N-acetylglucosamine O-acyltransferase [Roseomonas sp. KE2513]